MLKIKHGLQPEKMRKRPEGRLARKSAERRTEGASEEKNR